VGDDRLRALERRFRETGAVADEAAWLGERVRAGALARERVAIAGWCGHAAAALAADGGLPAWWSEHVRDWLSGRRVDVHSPRPPDPFAPLATDARVALAALEPVAPRSEGEALLRRQLDAWLVAGADPHRTPVGRPVPNTSPDHGPADLLCDALGYACRFDDPDAGRTAQHEWDSYRARWSGALEWAERLAPQVDLRAAARRAVIAWTLGV
jgi:hypothetical protein